MPVTIVYSLSQNVRRRLIVSDEKVDPGAQPGEGVLEIPDNEYAKMGPREVDAFLSAKVGPASSDRCVEVNAKGLVIACHHADPAIDGATLELHASAEVGDIKLAGEFVSMKPIPVLTKEEASAQAEAFALSKGEPISKQEADAIADDKLAEDDAARQKQAQAADQVKP